MENKIYRTDYQVLNQARELGKEVVARRPTPVDLFDPTVPFDVDELSFLSGYYDGVREAVGDLRSQISDRVNELHKRDIDLIFARGVSQRERAERTCSDCRSVYEVGTAFHVYPMSVVDDIYVVALKFCASCNSRVTNEYLLEVLYRKPNGAVEGLELENPSFFRHEHHWVTSVRSTDTTANEETRCPNCSSPAMTWFTCERCMSAGCACCYPNAEVHDRSVIRRG